MDLAVWMTNDSAEEWNLRRLAVTANSAFPFKLCMSREHYFKTMALLYCMSSLGEEGEHLSGMAGGRASCACRQIYSLTLLASGCARLKCKT